VTVCQLSAVSYLGSFTGLLVPPLNRILSTLTCVRSWRVQISDPVAVETAVNLWHTKLKYKADFRFNVASTVLAAVR
jgi:hypothetical protein